MVLDGGRNNRLLIPFNGFPEVTQLWDEDGVLFDGGFAC
jgi:hypothetical protein